MLKFHNSDLWIAWIVIFCMEGKFSVSLQLESQLSSLGYLFHSAMFTGRMQYVYWEHVVYLLEACSTLWIFPQLYYFY